nr:MAG TPA: hypothetical protein [Caudoviricetes sp.]
MISIINLFILDIVLLVLVAIQSARIINHYLTFNILLADPTHILILLICGMIGFSMFIFHYKQLKRMILNK